MNKKKSFSSKALNIIPGFLVCLTITILSKFLSQYVPKVGPATLAILIGIVAGNVIGQRPILNKGTKFCEHTLLSISIVLLGGTLSFASILHIGVNGLLFIIFQMLIVIVGTLLIGKAMKFSTDFTLLMASGNAVCGSSAIGSTAPAIHASSRDKGISITMVNVTGTVLMLTLPLATSTLYNNSVNQSSAMIGGILQSVGQAVACGEMVSEEVKELATIYKIVRVIMLVFVVFLLAAIKDRSAKKAVEDIEEEISDKRHKSPFRIPWYIVGFFITCVLFSIGIIPLELSRLLKISSNFIEIIALAGIGMRVYIRDLIQQGLKTSLYCTFIAAVQIISAIALIKILL